MPTTLPDLATELAPDGGPQSPLSTAARGLVTSLDELALSGEQAKTLLSTYTAELETQGDTGTASAVKITHVDRTGRKIAVPGFLRVRICNDATLANSTNATIAGANGGVTAAETHQSTKDLTFTDQRGVAQVETATVVAASGATSAGNLPVTVTAAGLTGSPLTIQVALADDTTDDTAAEVATKIRAALNGNAAITAMFTVGGSSADVSLTKKTAEANDSTLNIAWTGVLGITAVTSSTNTTAGVLADPGVFRVAVTDASAETVQLRIGAPLVGAPPHDFSPTLRITHAAP